MAKKDLGVVPAVYPMPVLIVAAYDKDGKVNAMNAALGSIASLSYLFIWCASKHLAL